ncbi:MAG: cytochrome c biogenesis protein CcdA [Bacteroidota bacterium]|nr:cytochrome c biogenesis protein CcdA [Bacteroidota bacterium]
MKHLLTFPLLVLMLFSASALQAQEAAKWSVRPASPTVKAGGTVEIRVTAKLNDNWHVYSVTPMEEGPVPTEIDFAADAPLARTGKVRQPKPVVKYDEAFGVDTEYFDEDVTFTLTGKVKASAKSGRQKVVVEVTFMACNDRLCLPPNTVELPFEITIEAGEAAAAVADEAMTQAQDGEEEVAVEDVTASVDEDAAAADEASEAADGEEESLGYGDERDVERAKEEGLWAYIGLAMSVGALALLTPCVFPMIPITVSFFTKREAATRFESVRDALIYSFGIIFTFTGLGILLALLFGASGINQFAANPWMNILIALVFIVFALNLFGLFEIVVPSGILTKLTVASGSGRGIASLLLMGLTFTLTSFTCTVPFVGTVMVAAAKGEIWWSIVGMLAFSSVFALPFFLLALFPSWLKSMPKSGGWLNSVKVVMGFLELAAAMKFISNVDLIWGIGVLSRDLFLSFWVGIGIMITVYLLGKVRLPHDSPVEKVGVMRLLWSVFFLGISVYLYTGLHDRPLGELDAFLPPMHYQETIQAAGLGSVSMGAIQSHGPAEGEKEQWYSDFESALVAAQEQSKPVFLDFTGFACTNCRWMESNIFPRSDVRELFKDFILVRLYTDGQGEVYDRNREFQEARFGTVALPLYVTLMPDGEKINAFPGLTRKPQEFVRFLSDGLSKFRKAQAVALR